MVTPQALSEKLQTASRSNYSGVDELWAAEKYLKTYNADLVRKLSAAFEGETEILEFGAGIGTLAQLWSDRTGIKPVCLEIDGKLRQILAARGFRCHESVESVHRAYGGVYTANVMEHIEDDLGELVRLRAVMKAGAAIAVYVPAFMCLYSGLDSTVGHYRRYSRRELLAKLQQAGFEIVDSYFVDSLGFFASLALKILGYKDGANLGTDRNVGLYDKYVYPVSRCLDYLGLRFLFGKNLLVVARKA